MANKIEEILGTAASIAKGMGVTFKEMMGPTVTDDYPDAPPKFEERFRGVHVLQRDVNGMEKCVADRNSTRFRSVTFKEMMGPTVTDDYPDAPPKFEERFRGVHVLQRDVNGMEKCVACFLCAAACPSNCIYIEAAENTATTRISGGERYAKVYNIDYNRCIFCGYCVEACPTDAITHGHGFEAASYNTATLVKRKEDMLVVLG